MNVTPSHLLDSVQKWEFKGEITEDSGAGSTSWTREWVEPGQVQVSFRAGGGGTSIVSTKVNTVTRPEGIAEADWEKMNLAEKVLCATGSFRCGTMIADALKANAFAEEQADGGEDVDNIFDAIRHAYWSALMTRDMGSTKAKLWNEAHEWGASDAQAICMDRYNNAVGRKIGQQAGSGASDAKLRQLVLDAANQGDLKDAKGC